MELTNLTIIRFSPLYYSDVKISGISKVHIVYSGDPTGITLLISNNKLLVN